MSAVIDILGGVWRVLGSVAPIAAKMLESGVTEASLTSTLIAAAQSTAAARIDARAGHATSPLAVEVEHLRDRAIAMRAKGRPDLARTLEDMARDLRGDEPTSERPLPPRGGR